MTIILGFIQLVIILSLAPFCIGLVRFFKARLQGRRGANPFLSYFSLATLMRKQMVISTNTTWVFRLVPYVVLGSTVVLAFILPLITFGYSSNLFVVAGILMIGAIFLVFGGIDSASAFGGMGASREMTISALLEPTIIITLAGFAVVTGTSDIGDMVAAQITIIQTPHIILSIGALIMIALSENKRYPIDNPSTHLELTMIHEAMVLEYSGPYLAMLEFASYIKITIFALLLSNIIWPSLFLLESVDFISIATIIILTIAKLIISMALLAFFESIITKIRLYRMQEYLTGAFLLGLAGLVIALITNTL